MTDPSRLDYKIEYPLCQSPSSIGGLTDELKNLVKADFTGKQAWAKVKAKVQEKISANNNAAE